MPRLPRCDIFKGLQSYHPTHHHHHGPPRIIFRRLTPARGPDRPRPGAGAVGRAFDRAYHSIGRTTAPYRIHVSLHTDYRRGHITPRNPPLYFLSRTKTRARKQSRSCMPAHMSRHPPRVKSHSPTPKSQRSFSHHQGQKKGRPTEPSFFWVHTWVDIPPANRVENT